MNIKRAWAPMTTSMILLLLTALPNGVLAEPDLQGELSSDQVVTYQAENNKNQKKSPQVAKKKSPPKQTYKVTRADLDEAQKIMDTALLLIKSEAREKPLPFKITNCVIDSLTKYIKEEGYDLPSNFFQRLDKNATAFAASRSLHEQFLKAATTYPNLMKDQKLTEAALRGIMKSTDDPYTVYLDPEENKMLEEQMKGGNFGGIGIVMELKGSKADEKKANSILVVSKVMPNTPSSKAGLKAKDELIYVDGKPTYGLSLNECSKLLRGEPGSKVVVTVRRPSSGHTFDVTLEREVIHVETLKQEIIEKDGLKIGYIYLGIFGESTNSEIEKAIRQLESEGCQAYILDVRENSGGYVTAAVDVCSKFLPTGSRVVSIVGGNNHEQVVYSRPNLHSYKKPLVVLINDSSASASEITAGAIRDLKRGQLVGIKSFGKGSVQKLYPQQFPKDKTSSFKITTAHYHTPAGHDIHKAGLQPDHEVKMDIELVLDHDKDLQLQKAIELLKDECKTQSSGEVKLNRWQSVPIVSLQDEFNYLNGLYENYTLVERKTDVNENGVIDTLTVEDPQGIKHSHRFIFVPKFIAE